jgi:hypothetical protein
MLRNSMQSRGAHPFHFHPHSLTPPPMIDTAAQHPKTEASDRELSGSSVVMHPRQVACKHPLLAPHKYDL